jgi:hypothetical protein
VFDIENVTDDSVANLHLFAICPYALFVGPTLLGDNRREAADDALASKAEPGRPAIDIAE